MNEKLYGIKCTHTHTRIFHCVCVCVCVDAGSLFISQSRLRGQRLSSGDRRPKLWKPCKLLVVERLSQCQQVGDEAVSCGLIGRSAGSRRPGRNSGQNFPQGVHLHNNQHNYDDHRGAPPTLLHQQQYSRNPEGLCGAVQVQKEAGECSGSKTVCEILPAQDHLSQ